MRGRRRFRRVPLPPPDVQRARMNEKIGVHRVLLIDEEGQKVGIIPTDEARARAAAAELDLVEVAPEAKPPVCRIMNYGKFLFEQQKKEKAANKKKTHVNESKEVRLRPGTGKGDMDIKAKHAREFLEEGYKVVIQLLFRGREQAHPEVAVEKIKEFAAMLEDVAKIEQMPRKEGRRMNALLAPLPNIRAKADDKANKAEADKAEAKEARKSERAAEKKEAAAATTDQADDQNPA